MTTVLTFITNIGTTFFETNKKLTDINSLNYEPDLEIGEGYYYKVKNTLDVKDLLG